MSNILISDAGATKTSWSLLRDGHDEILRLQTLGINPVHQSENSIKKIIETAKCGFEGNHIDEVFFFGAGCASIELKEIIRKAIKDVLVPGEISVESDLIGASIALFGENEGIACILGTGSASAMVKQGKIIMQTPSLGYILGDEGSGVALGITLLNAIFKERLPKHIIEYFQEEYKLSLTDLITNVYRSPNPAYIASFSPFLWKHLDEYNIALLVKREFEQFFYKNILRYLRRGTFNLGFVGSIAFHFAHILKEVAENFNLKVEKILKEPMPELENFYSKK